MSYVAEDKMPSLFFLPESKRQSIVTVFNWTEAPRHHRIALADLDSSISGGNQILDVFTPGTPVSENAGTVEFDLPPHSVRMLKVINTAVAAAAPNVTAHARDHVESGMPAEFSATADEKGVPAVTYNWEFGDGTSASGAIVKHTFTHEGTFSVHLRADGIEGVPFEKTLSVVCSGRVDTRFHPEQFQRYAPEH
jgi:PKD repeat protein